MLEMREQCERCGAATPAHAHGAFICSFECSFCASCAAELDDICPNCQGELMDRPPRSKAMLKKYPANASPAPARP